MSKLMNKKNLKKVNGGTSSLPGKKGRKCAEAFAKPIWAEDGRFKIVYDDYDAPVKAEEEKISYVRNNK